MEIKVSRPRAGELKPKSITIPMMIDEAARRTFSPLLERSVQIRSGHIHDVANQYCDTDDDLRRGTAVDAKWCGSDS